MFALGLSVKFGDELLLPNLLSNILSVSRLCSDEIDLYSLKIVAMYVL